MQVKLSMTIFMGIFGLLIMNSFGCYTQTGSMRSETQTDSSYDIQVDDVDYPSYWQTDAFSTRNDIPYVDRNSDYPPNVVAGRSPGPVTPPAGQQDSNKDLRTDGNHRDTTPSVNGSRQGTRDEKGVKNLDAPISNPRGSDKRNSDPSRPTPSLRDTTSLR